MLTAPGREFLSSCRPCENSPAVAIAKSRRHLRLIRRRGAAVALSWGKNRSSVGCAGDPVAD